MYAFSSCGNLTEIVIPDSMRGVSPYAFSECGRLKKVVIPYGTTEIGEGAFSYCTSLKEVYYGGTEEDWAEIEIESDNEYLKKAVIHYTEKEHIYGDWTVTKEATCTEAGSRERTCIDCGEIITEVIPASGHKWNEEYTVDKMPTSKEEGSKSIHCMICDAIKEGSEVPIPAATKDLSTLVINGIENKTYTGKEITQEIEIRDGGYRLVENTDYTVVYYNNTNTGIASANIKGIGNYFGTVTMTFLILPGKTTRGDMFNLANNVKVTWKEVPGAQYYKVYREGVTNPKESIKEPVIVTTGLVGWDKESGLVNGHAYRYRIVASLTGKMIRAATACCLTLS